MKRISENNDKNFSQRYLTALEETAVHRSSTEIGKEARLCVWLRRANEKVVEARTTLNRGSLFANSLDRRKNGPRRISVWRLPAGTKRRRCSTTGTSRSIRERCTLRERVNEKEGNRGSWNATTGLVRLCSEVPRASLEIRLTRDTIRHDIGSQIQVERRRDNVREDFVH